MYAKSLKKENANLLCSGRPIQRSSQQRRPKKKDAIDGSYVFTQGQYPTKKEKALLLYYLCRLWKSIQRTSTQTPEGRKRMQR